MSKCLICFEDIQNGISIYDYFKKDDVVCGNCRAKLERCQKTAQIEEMQVYALYYYNDFIENLLFQFKEGRDVALKELFIHQDIRFINKKYKNYTLVFVPSSQTKTSQRGFLPLDLMCEKLKLEREDLFEKRIDYKQNIQTYHKRKDISKVIKMKKSPKNKRILLFDDMCTSGSSLLTCFRLLKKVGIEDIKVISLAINYHLFDK